MAEATDILDRVRVLGRFELALRGRPVDLPAHAQRVLGYLAVVQPTQSRSVLAGSLWGDTTQERAQATLRNTLWRLRKTSTTLLDTSRDNISIAPHVWIDVAYARRCAAALEAGKPVAQAAQLISMLDSDLLTGWDEDWLHIERERLRQLRIHALEALAETLTRQARYAQAIQAALAAIRAEPLRESAQITLIKAYISEGNPSEAIRQFKSYRRLLADELGLRPSQRVDSLLHQLRGRK
jgi:DNA-binding SARP family transcriptional activator